MLSNICKIKCIEHRIWNTYHNAILEYIQQTECRIITSTANERNELNGRNGLGNFGKFTIFLKHGKSTGK